MRPLFNYFLGKARKDRTYIYSNFARASLRAKDEIIMLIGVGVYELTDFMIRKKKEELNQKLGKLKTYENELKDKNIL